MPLRCLTGIWPLGEGWPHASGQVQPLRPLCLGSLLTSDSRRELNDVKPSLDYSTRSSSSSLSFPYIYIHQVERFVHRIHHGLRPLRDRYITSSHRESLPPLQTIRCIERDVRADKPFLPSRTLPSPITPCFSSFIRPSFPFIRSAIDSSAFAIAASGHISTIYSP